MGNTYSQVHLQFIFAVKYRAALVAPAWQTDLYKYITGIAQNHNHKVLAINGMPDHIHLLIGMRTTQSIADLMQDVKGSSAKWVNENKLSRQKFEWQEGYGVFSYSASHIPAVVEYILNQQEHHKKRTFTEEYIEFLKKFNIEYDERYILKEPV